MFFRLHKLALCGKCSTIFLQKKKESKEEEEEKRMKEDNLLRDFPMDFHGLWNTIFFDGMQNVYQILHTNLAHM